MSLCVFPVGASIWGPLDSAVIDILHNIIIIVDYSDCV